MKNRNYTVVSFALLAFALAAAPTDAQSTYEPYTFTTLAGGSGNGSADTTKSAARFWFPTGVAVDTDRNIYVADFYLNTIRKGSPAFLIDSSGPGIGFFGGKFGFNLINNSNENYESSQL